MSREFKGNFLHYLYDVSSDVMQVKGTDEEMRKQLIEIAQDIIETLECRLQIESQN